VTHGIISAKGRDSLPGGGSRPFQSFLQTDAAINPGNSGGPLVNMAGEVIGINTAIISDTRQSAGLGFALPTNTAVKVYNQLVQSGKVTRGGIGISYKVEQNSALCRAMGLKSDCGVIVEAVTPGLPAAKAGIREGDVITEIDGTPIANTAVLLDTIANTPVGKTIRVKVNRDGRETTIPVTVADRTEILQANGGERDNVPGRNDQGEGTPARLGIRIQDITPDMVRQLRLPSQDGVYVSAVDADSAAEDAGITRGTIITRVIAGTNQRYDIKNVEDFRRIEKNLKSGQEIAFGVLQQQRGGQYRSGFVALTIP